MVCQPQLDIDSYSFEEMCGGQICAINQEERNPWVGRTAIGHGMHFLAVSLGRVFGEVILRLQSQLELYGWILLQAIRRELW